MSILDDLEGPDDGQEPNTYQDSDSNLKKDSEGAGEEERIYTLFRNRVNDALSQGRIDQEIFRSTTIKLLLNNPDPDLIKVLQSALKDDHFPSNLRKVLEEILDPARQEIYKTLMGQGSRLPTIEKLKYPKNK